MPTRPGIRDRRKDEAYFAERLRKLDDSRRMYEERLAAGTTPAHTEVLRLALFREALERLSARYSCGEPPSALRGDYPGMIDALVVYRGLASSVEFDSHAIDVYVQALWVLALGVLLDADDATFRRAVDAIGAAGTDAVLDRLVALRLPERWASPALLHPDPYEALVRALDGEGASRSTLMRDFLDHWYQGLHDTYWYESHARRETNYFGYWCFEAAAFVKALGIDDTPFADHPNYPRDLVHAGDGGGR